MRVINHIFLAAAAAALALVSCTKETTDNTENTQGQKSGVRTITVAFSKPDTRTSPTNVTGGIQPVWATDDQLTISNGSTTKTIDVPAKAVGNTTFTFTTDLTGTIDVYYPGGDLFETYWNDGNAKISSIQTGEFATANLCKGTVAENGTNLTLTNQTALFQVTPPSGVKQFTITSLKSVVDGVARTGTAQPINTDGADAAAKLVITVGDNSAELGICYVALASGVNLSDLSFEYTTDDTHGAMKGIPMKDIPEGKDAVTAGNVYTITANNWHEYVTVNGKKWATMNVGASSPTDYGDYFAWGEVVGHKYISDQWTNFPTENPEPYRYTGTWSASDCFADCNTPYYDGGEYSGSKYNDAFSATLELSDDAANVQWGGSWRMPTKEELGALWNLSSKAWTDSYNSTGVKGRVFSDGTNSVFFPAADSGNGADPTDPGDFGHYWSSSLRPDYPCNAGCLFFFIGSGGTGSHIRSNGHSVRPLSE